MKKNTFYIIIIIILVLLNVSFLIFNWYSGLPKTPNVDQMLIRELHWNHDQIEQFEQLKRQHRKQIINLDEKSKLIALQLLQSNPDSSLIQSYQQIQLEKVWITKAHFEDLKGICSDSQKPIFDQLKPKLIEILIPMKKR